MDTQQEIKLYPIDNKFIAFLDVTSIQPTVKKTAGETVVMLDQSGSMGDSVYNLVHNVLPRFFEFLAYDPETTINLLAFETRSCLYKIKVRELKNLELYDAGGTNMAPAVRMLHDLFEEFQDSVTSLRILTISDGEVFDQPETKSRGEKLAEFAGTCNIAVNSQAVRFFTSTDQPDTTALCSLLQLNNVNKCQMVDINARTNVDGIAQKMAELFTNDGFHNSGNLKSDEAVFYKFPWDTEAVDNLMILPDKKNIFWVDKVPKGTITMDDQPVKISILENIKFDELLQSSQLDLVIDRMKLLKIVDTELARQTIDKIVEYVSKLEEILIGLAADEEIDFAAITNRARLLKLKMIMSKQITTFLQTIANDNEVNNLNAEQKAKYLRNVEVSSKAGRGLAKRSAKKNSKNWKQRQSFDEIIHNEVKSIKANFHEIKDIDDKSHAVSFYSQSTTIEGLKTLIELSEDMMFSKYTADDILQLINIVGVACNSPKGDFPDASTWRVNEIYYGCYISVGDIITSVHQTSDDRTALMAPGIGKEITNVIPVFDDPRIAIFLKKYAPSILEFSSSIGMRRVIADVPMTLGYTIIAGIRRMMYDLNKNKSTVHLETFKNFVSTASAFVGKYFSHIEKLLVDQRCGLNGYYLGSNGIANLIVPLIRIHSKKDHVAVKRMPDILRSVYSHEIWKGISKEFKGKQQFNFIIQKMLHKLLGIDLESQKVKLAPLFESEPCLKNIKFPDDFNIDQEYLDSLTKPLYYHNYMTLLPVLLGSIEDIKNLPEMSKTSIAKAFGIDYSYKTFVFLNVFQALRYPRSNIRFNTKTETINLLDVRYHKLAIEDVKDYVREEFKKIYEFEVKAKNKLEDQIMANEIVEKIINQTSYRDMVNIWKYGITRNNSVYKISNSSSNGFKLLCRKLVDMSIKIPLRSRIISILLLGVSSSNRTVYNNGKVCDLKNLKKYKKRFLVDGSLEDWNKIEEKVNNRSVHVYREKENRRGHGNLKRSYWALGYNNVIDYLTPMTKKRRIDYLDVHNKCCIDEKVRDVVRNMLVKLEA